MTGLDKDVPVTPDVLLATVRDDEDDVLMPLEEDEYHHGKGGRWAINGQWTLTSRLSGP